MSVIKRKRNESQFEVFHQLFNLRKKITYVLLNDFGYSRLKQDKRNIKYFGNKNYEEMSESEKSRYDIFQRRMDSFDEWYILDERTAIVNCLRNIVNEVFLANSIYPTCMEEYTERRLHQDRAIGYCYGLTQELEYVIETLPVDINKYTEFADMIQKEINLIKGWRKSDNKFKGNF